MIIALLVQIMHCEGLASALAKHKPLRTLCGRRCRRTITLLCSLCTWNIVNH